MLSGIASQPGQIPFRDVEDQLPAGGQVAAGWPRSDPRDRTGAYPLRRTGSAGRRRRLSPARSGAWKGTDRLPRCRCPLGQLGSSGGPIRTPVPTRGRCSRGLARYRTVQKQWLVPTAFGRSRKRGRECWERGDRREPDRCIARIHPRSIYSTRPPESWGSQSLAAAGFQPAKNRLEGGCGQDCPPHRVYC